MFGPIEGNGQTNKRSKTKAKTTQNSKKTTPAKKSSPKTSAEAKKRQEETRKEIQLTETQLKENEVKVSKKLSELGKIEQEIEKTNVAIKTLNRQLENLNGQIKNLEGSIATNEADLAKLRDEYLKAVKKMRVTKKNKSSLAFIFASKTLNQVLRRMRYLQEFSSWRSRQTDEINGKIEDLKMQKEALAKAKDERLEALILQQTNEAKLSQQRKQQQDVIEVLKKNGQTLTAHLKKKQAEAKELGGIIAALIAEEQKREETKKVKATQKNASDGGTVLNKGKNEEVLAKIDNRGKNEEGSTNKGEYAKARKRTGRGDSKTESSQIYDLQDSGFEGMKGKLPKPSSGRLSITSRFGRQQLPDLPDVEYENPGIDAETEAGANALAVFKGKVSGVYLLPGYETVVIVNHGGYYTVYGNIASPNVKVGDSVDMGSILGKLSLSEEDSNHSVIHFEVWRNREKLNPQEWIKI